MSQTNVTDYYKKRCAEIGLTEETNKLLVKEFAAIADSRVIEYSLLEYDKQTGDVMIPIYGLDGHPVNFYKDNSGKLQNGKAKPLIIRRFTPERYSSLCDEAKKAGKKAPGKYMTPQGAVTYPWISPNIIQDRLNKKEIHTIIITEGMLKGMAGYLNGLHIFALSGIQNYMDKQTGKLHTVIREVIKDCKVKNVILLYDGDCIHLSSKAIQEETDLYVRPKGFYDSARGMNELLKEFSTDDFSIDVFFAHINSDELEGNPKGLDDLYSAFQDEKESITKDLITFGKKKPQYFIRFEITNNQQKLYKHFHISTHEQFYIAYNQIIKDKIFVFRGTKYQFDSEKNELKVIIPGSAKNYFRVGDVYYERLYVPNKYGKPEYQYHKRQSGTITQDHGKNILQHIEKYKAFCVKPDHETFQPIIDNCYNRYNPFEHEASDEDDCPVILDFMKHIFDDQLELGLDYVQLLYQKPTQILPILCLVSKENNTGKSTFGKLLKAIFTGNMSFIGNSDLENDFNSAWASKLIICCEESFIEKKKTMEKIKALSTGDKITMNQKGVDQVEIDFFGKFLFMSNNENNFIIATKHDERFWVRRVPKASKEITNLLEQMIDEIPNFLCFLNKRKLSTECESRMWFHHTKLRTAALENLVNHNKSVAEKELVNYLRQLFMDAGFYQLQFTLKYICDEIFRKRYETGYIEKIIKEHLNLQASKKVMRFTYPEIKRAYVDNKYQDQITMNEGHGRPITFRVEDYCTPDEVANIELSPAALSIGQESKKDNLSPVSGPGVIVNQEEIDF
jgi:hypothetical protein